MDTKQVKRIAGKAVKSHEKRMHKMAAGLSYYIAGKIPTGAERLGFLKQQYDEAWELAAYEDHEKAALRLVPRQTYIGR